MRTLPTIELKVGSIFVSRLPDGVMSMIRLKNHPKDFYAPFRLFGTPKSLLLRIENDVLLFELSSRLG